MQRTCGVLLHVSSLPSKYGVGDFGPEAFRFADWLHEAGQTWWQVLPLNPTGPGLGNSPYSSYSAFAGNVLFVSPEAMVEAGWLAPGEAECEPVESGDFEAAERVKGALLSKAFARAEVALPHNEAFGAFCRSNAFWLDDYALFVALKQEFGGAAWPHWPEEVRDRDPGSLGYWSNRLWSRTQYEKFVQFLFFQQWGGLRDYLRERGIKVIGDAPIYVTLDSADCWAHQHLFKLDEKKEPVFVAGVPPDYFSKTGQRWGNPVYDWPTLEAENFGWWVDRLQHNFGLYDLVRLDHFRGFAAYWEIPAEEPTAINGDWIFASGFELLDTLRARIGEIPLIAEDLGVITPDVVQLKDEFGLPGMKVLQFAFTAEEPSGNRDMPYYHTRNCVAYTGTHDNNTTLGWFLNDAAPEDVAILSEYLGKEVSKESVCWDMIRLCYASVADIAVVPIQDMLCLGEQARMNMPSTTKGNWSWRLSPGALTPELAEKAKDLVELFGRTGRTALQYDDYPIDKENNGADGCNGD